MSKHNKINYSKFANNNVEETSIDQVEDILEEVEEVIEEPVEDISEEVIEEPVAKPEPEPIVGVVSGCAKLRVRNNPSIMGEVICEIKEGTIVIIDEDKSTVEFYKVVTEAGAEGYCMKKYIDLK